MQRRPFLELTGLASAGLGFSIQRSLAVEDPAEVLCAKFVPLEKNLPADWLASLVKRGHQLDAVIRHFHLKGHAINKETASHSGLLLLHDADRIPS